MEKLTYYFDFLSPFSYLSWQWVKKNFLEQENYPELQLSCRPVSMATIIKAHETKGPAEIPSKRNYLFRFCLRWCALNQIPFCVPERLPFNSIPALRLALVAEEGKEQLNLIDGLFHHLWGNGKNLEEEGDLLLVLEKNRLPKDYLDRQFSDKQIRKTFKENHQLAWEQGVFGVPTFIYKGELFWGNDSISHLEMSLKNGDPLPAQKYQKFLSLF